MTKDQHETTARSKKPYSTPQIRRVELRAEEAVLGACKTGSKVGPAQPTCNVPSACSSMGS